MTELPARPNLDHLRRKARDLLRAAQAGDPAAAGRIRAVSIAPTLASAQLAVAREYGFTSWARLKAEVDARTTDLARQAAAFCEASIRDWTGRAARMLAAHPELAGYSFATAVILGDADRVRAEITRDPGLATRVDARSGWTPNLATVQGRADVADLLRRYGAADDTTDTDRFLAACQHADRAAIQGQLSQDPGLPGRLGEAQQAAALIRAADVGHTEALGLMLDLGFPVDARGGDHGGTALHAAAYAGSADAVRLLLARGADLEARDGTWDSTPLDWAAVGSSERPATNPRPDRIATVQVLLEAGASTEGITLSPDEAKQPSPDIAALLRAAPLTNH